MAFFSGTIKGYTLLKDLASTIRANPAASGLDLAGDLVGRYKKGGEVVVLATDSMTKPSLSHFDLAADANKVRAAEIAVPSGKITSFAHFILQANVSDIGEFVLYTNLPIELRGDILSRVLVPQYFHVLEAIDDDDVRKLFVFGPAQPEIMRISDGIKNDLIQNGIYRKLNFGELPGVYFCEKLDGIHLDSLVARNPFPLPAIPCFTLGNLNYPNFAKGIHRLHFDLSAFELGFNWVLKAVTELECLEQLHVTGGVVDRNYNGEFPNRVQVSFGQAKTELKEGTCLYPTFYYGNGDEAPGLEAVEAIRSLPTQEQEDRIYQLYLDFETIHQAMPKKSQFPKDCMFLIDFFPHHPPMV